MPDNKHYYRVNAEGFIVYGFSDAFEQPLESDVLVDSGGRQFNPTVRNERGQYMFKVVDGEIVERSQEELDEEYSELPSPAKTPDQIMIEMLQVQSGELLFELAQAQDEREAQNMQMGMLLMQISAIQEGIG